MSDENEALALHAARRRAFLAKSAIAAPAVAVLLDQAVTPAKASTYAPVTTTFYPT